MLRSALSAVPPPATRARRRGSFPRGDHAPQDFNKHGIAFVESLWRRELAGIVAEPALAWDEDERGWNVPLDRQRVMSRDGLERHGLEAEIGGGREDQCGSGRVKHEGRSLLVGSDRHGDPDLVRLTFD